MRVIYNNSTSYIVNFPISKEIKIVKSWQMNANIIKRYGIEYNTVRLNIILIELLNL